MTALSASLFPALPAVQLYMLDVGHSHDLSQQNIVVQLNGTIPPWGTKGGLTGLQWLAIDNNMLSGSLPKDPEQVKPVCIVLNRAAGMSHVCWLSWDAIAFCCTAHAPYPQTQYGPQRLLCLPAAACPTWCSSALPTTLASAAPLLPRATAATSLPTPLWRQHAAPHPPPLTPLQHSPRSLSKL